MKCPRFTQAHAPRSSGGAGHGQPLRPGEVGVLERIGDGPGGLPWAVVQTPAGRAEGSRWVCEAKCILLESAAASTQRAPARLANGGEREAWEKKLDEEALAGLLRDSECNIGEMMLRVEKKHSAHDDDGPSSTTTILGEFPSLPPPTLK